MARPCDRDRRGGVARGADTDVTGHSGGRRGERDRAGREAGGHVTGVVAAHDPAGRAGERAQLGGVGRGGSEAATEAVADRRHDDRVRPQDGDETGHLARLGRRRLEHRELGVDGAPQHRQRDTELAVEAARAAVAERRLAEERHERVLRRRLAERSDDGDDVGVEPGRGTRPRGPGGPAAGRRRAREATTGPAPPSHGARSRRRPCWRRRRRRSRDRRGGRRGRRTPRRARRGRSGS